MANPGGLAGVWAEANTSEAIFDALRRRESFGTSGPRIRVRFFGGWRYGADLPPAPSGAAAPRFVVWATKDAGSANLQKVQIIKGWSDGEETFEQVYDVACADGLEPDADTHRCADNGARVDLSDCSYSDGAGAAELSTTWSDPAFNPAQRAFYYATPRSGRSITRACWRIPPAAGRPIARWPEARPCSSRPRSRSAPGARQSGTRPPAGSRRTARGIRVEMPARG